MRINAGLSAGGQTTLEVELYYGAAFNSFGEVLLDEDTWHELVIGSTESVTKARITVHGYIESDVWEFELWDVDYEEPTPVYPGVAAALMGSGFI